MTGATAALATLRDHGITVLVRGDRLRLEPPSGGQVPGDMIELAMRYRDHLLEMLTPVGRCLDCRHGIASAGPDGLARCHVGRRSRVASAALPCPEFAPEVTT